MDFTALPFDIDALCKHWQSRMGSGWNAQVEKYVRDAWPKAVMHDSFRISRVLNTNQANLLSNMQTYSGITRPSGV